MWVAEQVWVEQPVEVVTAAFGRRPVTWLQPFLRLAWQDGGHGRADARDAHHDLRLRAAPPADGEAGSYRLRWDVTSPAGRSTFAGNLTIRSLGNGALVTIVTDVAGAPTDRRPTALRPEEMAVRSLLGQLRNALEASAPAQ